MSRQERKILVVTVVTLQTDAVIVNSPMVAHAAGISNRLTGDLLPVVLSSLVPESGRPTSYASGIRYFAGTPLRPFADTLRRYASVIRYPDMI